MLDEIQRYTKSVKDGSLFCDLDTCPRCVKQPRGFTRHDTRSRTFLVLAGRLVHKVLSVLTRWKCPLCGRPFTFYPAFALPYKRYVRQTIIEKTAMYIEEDKQPGDETKKEPGEKGEFVTYRKAVKEKGCALGYASTREGIIDERQLAPSTVYRWITSLAGLRATLQKALGLIKQKSATSKIFRQIIPVSPRKYRSDGRRLELQHCRRLLQVDREYRVLFGPSVFPHLATASGWQ